MAVYYLSTTKGRGRRASEPKLCIHARDRSDGRLEYGNVVLRDKILYSKYLVLRYSVSVL
jgi:hypothetical protein